MSLLSASSMVVPVAGVLVQPVLARALGTEDRGALAAALAPNGLLVAVAALGLPEAVIHLVSKQPARSRPIILLAFGLSMVSGIAAFLVSLFLVPWLSNDNVQVSRLIIVGLLAGIPTLCVGILRGAATAHNMWPRVAIERTFLSFSRVAVFVALWALNSLTLELAVGISLALPLISALVYVPLLVAGSKKSLSESKVKIGRDLTSYGSRVWLGTVTEMLLSRVSQLLIVPLAGLTALGHYSVAVAISDVPFLAALAIQTVLLSTMSKQQNSVLMAFAARVTAIITALGSVVLIVLVPLGIPLLFGAEFKPAVLPTILMLASAIFAVPGLMAASAVNAWGRPGVRSAVLMATLVINVAIVLLLVPLLGASGAAVANLSANVAMTIAMLVVARRVCSISPFAMVVWRLSDFKFLSVEVKRLWRRCFNIKKV